MYLNGLKRMKFSNLNLISLIELRLVDKKNFAPLNFNFYNHSVLVEIRGKENKFLMSKKLE